MIKLQSKQTERLRLDMSGQYSMVDWEEVIRCDMIRPIVGRPFLLACCTTHLQVEGVHLPLCHTRCQSLFSSTSSSSGLAAPS